VRYEAAGQYWTIGRHFEFVVDEKLNNKIHARKKKIVKIRE